MPGERNLISWVLRWRTNIYLVIQWLLLMHSYQWGQGTFVVFSHSDPANTHFVSVWAADHRWGTYHNLPGLSPPAVSVCVGLCQYHRRHPACPGAELPSPQVNLHTYTHTHTHVLTLNFTVHLIPFGDFTWVQCILFDFKNDWQSWSWQSGYTLLLGTWT